MTQHTVDGGDVESSFGVDVSSYNGRRADLVLSNDFERLKTLFIADIYRTDGYRDAASTDCDNYFMKVSKVFGDAKYSARFSHYQSDFTIDGYLNLPDLKAGKISRRDTQFLPGYSNANRNIFCV